jgi:hypothetical protein
MVSCKSSLNANVKKAPAKIKAGAYTVEKPQYMGAVHHR